MTKCGRCSHYIRATFEDRTSPKALSRSAIDCLILHNGEGDEVTLARVRKAFRAVEPGEECPKFVEEEDTQ